MKKWLKRICSAFLTVALLLSFGAVFGVENNSDSYGLSQGQIGLLRNLEIISSDNIGLSAEVTRGELAFMVAKFCNIPLSENAPVNAEFYDLSKEHKYYYPINECVGRGIFSGDGTGYFRPDDAATYQEACKVFSVALGYKIIGHLTSYQETARVSGITDGVGNSDVLTLGMTAKMAYNALHAGMFEPVSYGKEISYEINESQTALKNYHKLNYGTGILDGIYGTTLAMSNSEIPENMIQIDGKNYLFDGGEKLFGRFVVFYTDLNEDGKVPKIQYIYASEERNREVTVNAEDIMNKSGDVVAYYDGYKERRLNFSDEGDVIYNGVSYPEYGNADFKPASGSITFIDNNADNVYEVAIIQELQYMIAGGVDLENKIIYDKNDPTNVLGSKTDSSIDLRVMRGDDLAHMSIVTMDSPVAVCKSRNTKGIVKIRVYIPDKSITGLVDAVGNGYIGVDGEQYKPSRNMVSDEAVSIGDVVTLAIFHDQIGVVIHKKDGYMYGYLVDANGKGSAFKSTLMVKMMNSSRKEVVYECKKGVRIDETLYKNAEDAMRVLKSSADLTYQQYSSHPYSQPVRYKVDGSGMLTHIDTLTYDQTKENKDSLQLDKNWSTHRFYATSMSFYTDEELEYVIAPTTSTMVVPRKLRDDERWYTGSFSNNANYVVEAFNVDEFTCAPKYLVAYVGLGENPSVSGGALPFIVTDVSTTLDESGEVVKSVTMVGTSTTPITRVIAREVPEIDLQVGDVIRFSGGYEDKIVALERILSAGDVPSIRLQNYGTTTGPAFQSQIRYAYGTVVANKDGVLVHTTSITDDDNGVEAYENRSAYRLNANVNIPVWVYDDERKNPVVTSGLWTDLVPYEINKGEPTRALICTTSGSLKFLYICK